MLIPAKPILWDSHIHTGQSIRCIAGVYADLPGINTLICGIKWRPTINKLRNWYVLSCVSSVIVYSKTRDYRIVSERRAWHALGDLSKHLGIHSSTDTVGRTILKISGKFTTFK